MTKTEVLERVGTERGLEDELTILLYQLAEDGMADEELEQIYLAHHND